jgi:hypothetical protein
MIFSCQILGLATLAIAFAAAIIANCRGSEENAD